MRLLKTAGLALALSLGLAACGSSSSSNKTSSSTPASSSGSAGTTPASTSASSGPGKGKPAVTIGDKNFTEENILGELYAQALRAKGFTVNLKANIGSSEVTDKALTSGQLDMYPEYTGVILSVLAHQTKRPANANAAYQAAKTFEAGRGFKLLDKTPFFDSDALATTPAYAQKNKLSGIADLKKLGSGVSVGGDPPFKTRFEGIVGLKQLYGLTLVFRPLAIGLQYKALDTGQINLADVFTTDGQLQGGKYTLLKDPKYVFGFQNVAPVVSKKVLAAQGPAFAQTLNAVSAKLTTEAVQKMNAAVDLDKQKAGDVAKQFLAANGLA